MKIRSTIRLIRLVVIGLLLRFTTIPTIAVGELEEYYKEAKTVDPIMLLLEPQPLVLNADTQNTNLNVNREVEPFYVDADLEPAFIYAEEDNRPIR